MHITTILLTSFFSLFSTSVMSYIALATPIGPWIAPTLVLIGLLLSIVFNSNHNNSNLSYAVAGGSIGGIVATACAFSFPTIYFVNPDLFNGWLAHPFTFVALMGALVLCAGFFGFLIALLLEESFIIEQQMAFPIGQLVYKMLSAQKQTVNIIQLVVGFCCSTLFSIIQQGTRFFGGCITRSIKLVPALHWGILATPAIDIQMDVLPMLLAIGFIAGHLITIPLLVGIATKIVLVHPLHHLFFSTVTENDFILTFCSGMVIAGAIQSFFDLPRLITKTYRTYRTNHMPSSSHTGHFKMGIIVPFVFVCIVTYVFFSYFQFTLLETFYTLVVSAICTYQIALIAGKIGLAQLGRFATFGMVPALIIFGINPVQATIIATFIEIAGGVATDVLFGRKLGHLAQISPKKLSYIQAFGLIISSISIGIIFLYLISHFGLGSAHLFAQRAQARALLIHIKTFHVGGLIIGALYGLFLKKIGLNPLLVLGGLLMPIAYSIGLALGGIATFFVQNSAWYEPFWSGVFAANSLWQISNCLL